MILTWRMKAKSDDGWGEWKNPSALTDALGMAAEAAFLSPNYMQVVRVAFKDKNGVVYEYKQVEE